jgi:hypothetical protein
VGSEDCWAWIPEAGRRRRPHPSATNRNERPLKFIASKYSLQCPILRSAKVRSKARYNRRWRLDARELNLSPPDGPFCRRDSPISETNDTLSASYTGSAIFLQTCLATTGLTAVGTACNMRPTIGPHLKPRIPKFPAPENRNFCEFCVIREPRRKQLRRISWKTPGVLEQP